MRCARKKGPTSFALVLLQETRAQAVIETAVAVPVLLVCALIAYNLALFSAASARFDRIAPDVVIAQAVSPSGDDVSSAADAVAEELERAMGGYPVEVEVREEDGEKAAGASVLSLVAAPRTYVCVMRFNPWPRDFSVAGVRAGIPAVLVRERAVTIDPWRSGVIV